MMKFCQRLRHTTVKGVVDKVTCKEKKVLPGKGYKVALMDFGAKNNIAKSLNSRGCEVTIYPARDNGRGNLKHRIRMESCFPTALAIQRNVRNLKLQKLKKLYDSNVPIFAICLGHQLMALATGADTHKLKYGHRGANHPVKDLQTGKVYISSQNHGYVVDETTLNPAVAKPAFENVNDKTNEGLEYIGKNIFTVQFHPEACAGPQDTAYLFDRFIEMMKKED